MSDEHGDAKQLLELYNEVDHFMRQLYSQDEKVRDISRTIPHQVLIDKLSTSNRTIFRFQHEMRTIAQLRNCIVHNPFTGIVTPLLSPSPEVVKRYESIRNSLIHPRTALSIAIPASKIYIATSDTNLVEVLRAMSRHTYTHVPIVDDDKLTGILSENTLLSYIAESGDSIITNDMTVSDLGDYLPLRRHASESFVFLPRRAELAQVFNVFRDAIVRHVRIGMVFITEHGKETEKPLGIITAWDLTAPDADGL